jgi:hypothetical protein
MELGSVKKAPPVEAMAYPHVGQVRGRARAQFATD